MKIILYLKLIIGSFYDKDAYCYVAKKESAYLIPIIVLILAITATSLYFITYGKLDKFLEEEGYALIEQVPEITFNNGKAVLNTPLPLIIENERGTKIIIDSPSQYTNVIQAKANLLL